MREHYLEQGSLEAGPQVELIDDLYALTERLNTLLQTPHEIWAGDTAEQFINGITAYIDATGTPPHPGNAKPRTTDQHYRHMRAQDARQILQAGGFVLRISAQE